MLPNLSALDVTGVNNASVFKDTPEANREVARHHVNSRGDPAPDAGMPCWVALTRKDATVDNALVGIKFSLPCELFYLELNRKLVADPAEANRESQTLVAPEGSNRQVHHMTRPSNAQWGVDLSGIVRFNQGSRIELVFDTDSGLAHEFQVSIRVVTAQSDVGKKIAEHGFGLRDVTVPGNEPIWTTAVYEAAPARGIYRGYAAAKDKLKEIFGARRVHDGYDGNVELHDQFYDNQLKNWLPRLQNDVIFYYVECLTDRSYPPMVGAYSLETEDPAMVNARTNQWKDGFKTTQNPLLPLHQRPPPVMRDSVLNEGDVLRRPEDVLVAEYAKGLMTCPAKNFLFCRANAHELVKPGSDVQMRAGEEFKDAACGVKRPRGEAGPSGS